MKNGITPVLATYIVSFKLDKITRSNTCQNICEGHILTEGFGIDKHIWENISHVPCHNNNSVRIKSWWLMSERESRQDFSENDCLGKSMVKRNRKWELPIFNTNVSE